jgi:ketosteroid isomerase-like protein
MDRGTLGGLERIRQQAAVHRRVLTPFGARFTTSEPFRPVTIRSVYADGDTVIVVWDGRGMATDGVPYENSYVWIMRLKDGRADRRPVPEKVGKPAGRAQSLAG